ncbi:uncharacterized protein K452DRAFT_300085 [Aplosporella prunicola CBS 121167]|uniref:Uncharacterized protein n=1 Tax=Aplosporella prunicola CBS 121167 TaxID=1176127 RepID=A0A6A6B5X1_9PEZI|nr:uncharacterized protein K452DRAFT_300085 [Aplosporella prunicola CBS 121167]KAF2139522.1 hypothetical protein K452DRAFT_300085 [Aplosporella prunicola CBS 121167]
MATDEDKMFLQRCMGIIEGLSDEVMEHPWLDILPSRSASDWSRDILKYTAKPLKKLLSKVEAPTVKEIEALPWVQTVDFGTYGCFLVPPNQEHHHHLYCGSATSPFGGLMLRKKARDNPNIAKTE